LAKNTGSGPGSKIIPARRRSISDFSPSQLRRDSDGLAVGQEVSLAVGLRDLANVLVLGFLPESTAVRWSRSSAFWKGRVRIQPLVPRLALGSLRRGESFASFLEKSKGIDPGEKEGLPETIAALLEKLKTWCHEKDEGLASYLPLLELFGFILYYESNRPYELWYGKLPDISPLETKVTAALGAIRAKYPVLSSRVETYRRKLGEATQPDDRSDQSR
jgi:hypothetical protein